LPKARITAITDQTKQGGAMRILITNDDGINAPGLVTLTQIASELAGPKGEVWTVAPAFEQSGVGHCISYTHPMINAKLSERRYAVEGSPADCVLAGVFDVLEGNKPDLVLSGVNRGNNAGENVLYSGTIGAAMEAALHGIPAIALSQYMGRETSELDDPFEAAAKFGVKTIRALLDKGIWTQDDYRVFYNAKASAAIPISASSPIPRPRANVSSGSRAARSTPPPCPAATSTPISTAISRSRRCAAI
jgi:5'/3'-nucleotidase SurE